MNRRAEGAIQGAMAGSKAGPWGALVGGIIGTKMGGMADYQQNIQEGLDKQQAALQKGEHKLQLDDNDMRYASNFANSNGGYGGY